MIIEFDHHKSTVTFGGGRFRVCFTQKGFLKKNFEISVFEANQNFQAIDSKKVLFVETVPFDEKKILSAIKIISELDSGDAKWIPEKYLSKDRSSKDVQDLELIAAQMAFGKAINLLSRKDYEGALLNINASLLSKFLKDNPEYLVRFFEKQAEGFTGLENFAGAKKAILEIKKHSKNFDYRHYFSLGYSEHKLGNKKDAIENFERYIKLANEASQTVKHDVRERDKRSIEMARQLMSKCYGVTI